MPRASKRNTRDGAGRVRRRAQDDNGDKVIARAGEPGMTQVPFNLLVKLACIAVHTEEMLSPNGHNYDQVAVRVLLQQPDVRKFLDDPENQVYLPVKR